VRSRVTTRRYVSSWGGTPPKPYVLAVRNNEKLMVGDFHTYTAERLAADLAPHERQRLAADVGSEGPRFYDCGRLFVPPAVTVMESFAVWSAISDPADMAFYVTFAPDTTGLKKTCCRGGLCWAIE